MMSAFFQLFETVFCWPRLKYLEIRQNFRNSTPYKKFETTWKVAKLATNLIVVHVLDDCKWDWLTPIIVLLILETLTLPLYTMWFYWQLFHHL